MKVFASIGILSACLFAGAPDTARAADLPSMKIPEGLGFNPHFLDPRPGEMELVHQTGFRWIRTDFSWGRSEREKGKYDFSGWDALVAAMTPYKMRGMAVLSYRNDLYDEGNSPYTDEGRAAFARWAVAAVKHFRGQGIMWEMYNEPNNPRMWKPEPKVDDYVKLALTVGKALHEAAPDEIQVGPAMAGINFPFLEQCFKAGLLKYWSAVTVHPYRHRDPETVVLEYQHLQKLIDKYAPPGKKIPIYAAEWGFSDIWNEGRMTWQAKMLAREFLVNWSNDIPMTIWYDWHDDGDDPKEFEHHFGVVHREYLAGQNPVYKPKPAFFACRTFVQQLSGFTFQERLKTESRNDYVLAFSNGPEVCYAVWTRSDKPHDATLSIKPGKYSAVDHLGKKLLSVTAGADGAEFKLSDGPVYLTPKKSGR